VVAVTPITVKEKALSGHERIDLIFETHELDGEPITAMGRIRYAARAFAVVLHENTPKCSARARAIEKVDEAVMIANAAIARNGVCYR
jgi:hypothetical protein